MNDNYIQRIQPKSILAMPILYQGLLRRVLYLENNISTHAFAIEHIQNIELLASQAAISLENAYLYYQATHDHLTGLANRNLLTQTFSKVSAAMKQQHKQIGILFLDLDHFKTINDTLGHEIGDKLLQHMANQLNKCTRKEDLAVRLGGDEFVLLVTEIEYASQIKAVAERFYQLLTEPLKVGDKELYLSFSIGISIYPQDGTNLQDLLKQADLALYQAKKQGRNQLQFYNHSYSSSS